MILSSFTFSVEYSHALLFERSLKQDVIPFLLEIEGVNDVKAFKLISEVETGGQNISVQIFLKDMDIHNGIEEQHKIKFLSLLDAKYAGQYLYFQSLLEEI